MSREEVDTVKQNVEISPMSIVDDVHTVMHLLRANQYRALKDCPYELTHLEGKIMCFFEDHPGGTLSDVSEHFGRDKGQFAKLVKGLRSKGLLLGRADEKDRRSVKLELTKEGKKVRRTLDAELGAVAELAVRTLSVNDQKRLLVLLKRMQENLESLPE